MHFVLVNNKRNRADVLEHNKNYERAVEDLSTVIPLYNLILVTNDGTYSALSRSSTFVFSNGYYDFNSLDEILAVQLLPTNIARSQYVQLHYSRELPKDLGSACPNPFGEETDSVSAVMSLSEELKDVL